MFESGRGATGKPREKTLADTHGKPRGLFINTLRAQCSIHESGRMMHDCLRRSERFTIDYLELDPDKPDVPDGYDFYAFNYHHQAMGWLHTPSVRRLPGRKLTFVLEVLPDYPFALCPPDDFDAYCAIDPTMNAPDANVFAFPRPLEVQAPAAPHEAPATPVIGTFGLPTRGKAFDKVVEAVNREFDAARVRINIPAGTFTGSGGGLDYAREIAEQCRKAAKPGIEVVVTHDFMSKPELIAWCAQNTLNCFLYDRDMPGLAATTDQAVSSGRPLIVSDNPTFRHVLRYIRPYPQQSLRDAIDTTIPQVMRMQHDWAPERFAERFAEVIDTIGVTAGAQPSGRTVRLARVPAPTLWSRGLRFLRRAWDRAARTIRPLVARVVPLRKARCKFLASRLEVEVCTRWLKRHGLQSHRLQCKDFDMAGIMAHLSDGNLLDMGSSDSYLLANARRKGIRGELHGIDLRTPDVAVEGVTYKVGDLTETGLPAAHFENITCLSVLEHGIDFAAFAREAARLLKPGGHLYCTFDYWSPRVVPHMRLFGLDWKILDWHDVLRLVEACGREGLFLVEDIDWTLGKPVITHDYYSPERYTRYTFGMLVFRRQARDA